MKRRTLIKAVGLSGLGLGLGFERALAISLPSVSLSSRMRNVDISTSRLTFNTFPRVINVFLYGGPSELAGNLSNISRINELSQNKYNANLLLDRRSGDAAGAELRSGNHVWIGGGANAMEAMLQGGVMSLYRTMYRRKDDSKAHRESILQNQVGNLNMDMPGIGSTLAELIAIHSDNSLDAFGGRKPGDLLFPIVSFEGESFLFNRGDAIVAPPLRPTSLSTDTNGPFTNIDVSGANPTENQSISNLIDSVNNRSNHSGHLTEIGRAFAARARVAANINNVLGAAAQTKFDAESFRGTNIVNYAGGTANNNQFATKLKSAVSLMLNNPDTLFVALSSDGLGGWDDHSEAMADYPPRVEDLMNAVLGATLHIEAAKRTGAYPHADTIMINIMGDFGRNANLNNSRGWDHGNNQNFYTFGGKAFAQRTNHLGKIIGVTNADGSGNQNRLFTFPEKGSYEFEPFSVASSIYSYYNVTNPQVLTGEPAIDPNSGSVSTPTAWTPTTAFHQNAIDYLNGATA